MEKAQSRDGVSIAFDRLGEGPAVILVEGALGSRQFGLMGPVAALLAPHFTVFTYDRRGRGDSGDSGDQAPYMVEREVEDLDALITAAGGSACVYGASSGAVLAAEAAARGLAITKVALYEPPFILDESRPAVPEDFMERLVEMISEDRRGDAVAHFMTKAVGVPDEFVAEMRLQPMWAAMEQSAPTLIYDVTIMGGSQRGKPLSPEWIARLRAITASTLVMAGGASPEWLQNAAQSTASAIPGSRYRALEGQTHAIAAEVIAPVLWEFFSGQ